MLMFVKFCKLVVKHIIFVVKLCKLVVKHIIFVVKLCKTVSKLQFCFQKYKNRKDVCVLATQSIRKNIEIKSPNDAKRLIFALEQAKNKQRKDVLLSKPYHKKSREWIREHF